MDTGHHARLAVVEDWLDRYNYLIELGNELPEIDPVLVAITGALLLGGFVILASASISISTSTFIAAEVATSAAR